MWTKVDDRASNNNFLAIGDNVVQMQDRISVEINRNGDPKGSTLVIALAEDKDAGQYVCQLGDKDKKEIKHTVQVRGRFTLDWL